MKKAFKFLGIIALAAVIGFGVAACSDDDNKGGNNNNNNNGGSGTAKVVLKNSDASVEFNLMKSDYEVMIDEVIESGATSTKFVNLPAGDYDLCRNMGYKVSFTLANGETKNFEYKGGTDFVAE